MAFSVGGGSQSSGYAVLFPSSSSSLHTTQPWHTGLKQNCPSSIFSIFYDLLPADPNLCQCKMWSPKGEGEEQEDGAAAPGVCTGGKHSTLNSLSGLYGWCNEKAWKVCISSCDKPTHISLCDDDSSVLSTEVISQSATGNRVSGGKLLPIRCRVS